MQTIKGLITLLIVAVVVFTGVMIFDNAIGSRHGTKITQAAQSNTQKSAKQAAIGKTSGPAVHQQNQKKNL